MIAMQATLPLEQHRQLCMLFFSFLDFFFFMVMVVLGFELRTLHMLHVLFYF
jgi:hypothetical protein